MLIIIIIIIILPTVHSRSRLGYCTVTLDSLDEQAWGAMMASKNCKEVDKSKGRGREPCTPVTLLRRREIQRSRWMNRIMEWSTCTKKSKTVGSNPGMTGCESYALLRDFKKHPCRIRKWPRNFENDGNCKLFRLFSRDRLSFSRLSTLTLVSSIRGTRISSQISKIRKNHGANRGFGGRAE
jgi:hypothetical protein